MTESLPPVVFQFLKSQKGILKKFDVFPDSEVYFLCDDKRGKPVYGFTHDNQLIWFFTSSNGIGTKLDTAADIPVTVQYDDNQLIIQNAELALFFTNYISQMINILKMVT